MQNIAFLGLGTMGSGMALNLLKAGFSLRVYDRTSARAEALIAQGARLSATPHEAAEEADVIISMVSDDQASRAIWLGEQGALSAARRGSVLIECSSLSLAWILELGEQAQARHLTLLDAPVTGSKAAAEGGQLGMFVGGNPRFCKLSVLCWKP